MVVTVVWAFGAVWFVAAARTIVSPRTPALVLGAITMLFAPGNLTSYPASTRMVVAVAAIELATAVLLLAYGYVTRTRPIQGVAILGLLVGTYVLVNGTLAESDAQAGAVVFAGALLMAISVLLLATRDRDAVERVQPPPPPS